MSTPAMPSKLKDVTKPITYLGVGLIVLGILSIVLPRASGMTIGVLVGILLLLSGILRTTFAWIATSWGSAFLRFVLGVLAIAAGGFMIFQPETGLDAITIVVMVFLIADGLTQILISLRLPPGAGGIWVMVGGALSLLLGVLIWREWPVSGENAVGILVGVKLIMDGVAMIAVAGAIRAMGKAFPS
jgi:uncharacterized membrane protein HdeD (DUF308 family)